jgi:predicted nucleotidyltransferase
MSTDSAAVTVSSALFGKTRRAVLALLFCNSERSYHVREILRAAGAGHGAVQRELSHLVRAGLVARTQRGNVILYRANLESPVFDELRGLMIKTAGVADILRLALMPLAGDVRVAFVYGSFAKARETPSSDVDLMVVGDVTSRDVVSALGSAKETLDREVNSSVYPVAEFRTKLRQRNHFLTSVLESPRIFLIGDESDLRGLAQ